MRTSHSRDGLLARKIRHMHESVVEGRVDVGNAEDELALADLGAERDGFLSCCLGLLGGLEVTSTCQTPHPTQNSRLLVSARNTAAPRSLHGHTHHL